MSATADLWQSQRAKRRDGVVALVAAATIWGCFPVYWRFLSFTNSIDILSNRIMWSFAVGMVLHRIVSGAFVPRSVPMRQILLLLMSALVLSANWCISIYAVEVNRVVEGGIGMFFAPIFQLMIGRVLFKEGFNSTKVIVVSISVISGAMLIYDLNAVPYIAVGMGLSFATYATIKKLVSVPALQGFIIETGLLFLPAVAYVILNGSRLTGGGFQNTSELLLLAGAGAIAAPPLILYGFGAQRVSLSTSGMMLNLIPIINIAVGILVLREAISPLRGLSAMLVSVAVLFYSYRRGE